MAYISLENVSYTYNERKYPAVNNVTLDIYEGEKVAIMGDNGSGKSTLAKLILGLLKCQKGKVLLDGKAIDTYNLPQVGERLGYISSNPNQMLFNTSVYNEISFGLKWKGKSREETQEYCEQFLKYFKIWHLRNEVPFNLSEGQKQLIAIIAVLVLQPPMLILDEPTKSIDNAQKKNLQLILQEIWSKGTGLIVISHDRDFISYFNGRNIHMVKGKVVK